MSHFFSRDPGRKLLDKVATPFTSGKAKIRRDHKLVFVCGGPVTGDKKTLRSEFICYAEKHLTDYRVFLAESSFEDLKGDATHDFINIAELEDVLAEVSDCVLIFPESVGSFAEIGYFSAGDAVRRKVLLANRIEYQTHRSFLNDGPINLINRSSEFPNTVYLPSAEDGEADFSPLAEVMRSVSHKRSYRITPEKIENPDLKILFFTCVEVLRVFPALTAIEVSMLIKHIFGKSDFRRIRRLISILVSTSYVKRIEDEDYFYLTGPGEGFVSLEGYSWELLRAEIMEVYQRHASHVMDLLQEQKEQVA